MKKEVRVLWLDDVRDPYKGDWLEKYSPIAPDEVDDLVWVKSYNEFEAFIIEHGLPDAVCFDHDLCSEHYAPKEFWDDKYDDWLQEQETQEKTGYDAAKFLVEYCQTNNEPIPKWGVQSANPVGAKNINKYLLNYIINE
jgi:hypothetical protein